MLNRCSCGAIPELVYDDPFNYVVCPACGKKSMVYVDQSSERDGAAMAVKNWNNKELVMGEWKLKIDRKEFNGRCQDCKWFYSEDTEEPCSLCCGIRVPSDNDALCYFNAERMDTVKDKAGKPRMSLILPGAAEALVRVREYGLKKYPDAENWKRVPREDWLDAALRHLMRYIAGEKNDAESGLPHLWHVLTNISYMIEGERNDD